MADHALRAVDGDVLTPVVHGDGVANELGVDYRIPAPRLEHPLLVVLVHPEDALHKALLYVRILFRGPRHLAPPSFPPAPDDHGVRPLVLLTCRRTQSGLAPRRDRRAARRALALAAAMRVVDRVHDRPAHRRPDAEVPLAARLAPPDVLVRLVAHHAYGRPAIGADPAPLPAREPERHDVPLAGRDLGARPSAARHLRPTSRLELDGVDDGADRQVARGVDVALLAVVVVQERYVRRAVRVVLYRRDRGGHPVLVALEVYDAVAPLVTAALVAGRYAALVIATAC